MSKKKYRNIIVGGKEYAWSATDAVDECECHCTRVKIWADKNTLIFDEIWDEPRFVGRSGVKPSMIASKIVALKNYER